MVFPYSNICNAANVVKPLYTVSDKIWAFFLYLELKMIVGIVISSGTKQNLKYWIMADFFNVCKIYSACSLFTLKYPDACHISHCSLLITKKFFLLKGRIVAITLNSFVSIFHNKFDFIGQSRL